MTSVPTKVCGDCRRELPLEDFYRSRQYPDGRRTQCKQCFKAYEYGREHGVSRLEERRSVDAISRRFWAKVDKSNIDGCWLWTGSTTSGYGSFSIRSRPQLAHRVAYRLTHGEFDESLFLCHRCDTPLCVRPDHVFLGTQRDNMHDAAMKGRVRRGERVPNAKLMEAQVLEIRARRTAGETINALATEYGVKPRTIQQICDRTRWGHVA